MTVPTGKQIGSGSSLTGSHGVSDTGKTETEIRCFFTHCDADSAILARAIRRYWSIENA